LDLVVEDENESSTGSSEDVREGSLEEGLGSFVLEDFLEAIDGAGVKDISSTGLHHKSSSDGVKGIGDDSRYHGDGLGEGPHGEEVGLLGVLEEQDFTGIVGTEISSSVKDDTNN